MNDEQNEFNDVEITVTDSTLEEAIEQADAEAAEAAALPTDEDGDVTEDAPALKSIPQHALRGPRLLRKIWEQIKDDTSAWSQKVWVGNVSGEALREDVAAYIQQNHVPPWDCGTAYCLSGHAAVATGARLTDKDVNRLINPEYSGVTVDVQNIVHPETGDVVSIEEYGREVLELSESQASVMFSGSNTDPYVIELQVRALEENPRADLYEVQVGYGYAEKQKAHTWKVLHGFEKPTHNARRVYEAVQRHSESSRTTTRAFTALVLAKGSTFTDEEYYAVHALDQALNDTFPKVWEDLSGYKQQDYRYYAESLRTTARALGL